MAWSSHCGAIQVLGKRAGPTIHGVEYNEHGSQFVSAAEDGMVKVWWVGSDKPRLAVNVCPSPNSASFSPKGTKIIVACSDGTTRVIDSRSGRELTAMSAATAVTVDEAEFSPDGRRILTSFDSSGTGGVRIWNSELATPSLSTLERVALQRIKQNVTPGERRRYLAEISG